jgi:hypothetical protein
LADQSFILRRANVSRKGGHWRAEDYDVFEGERCVGRVFLDATDTWFWGVDFQLTHRISYGYARSLDEAKAAFKTEYEKWKKGA